VLPTIDSVRPATRFPDPATAARELAARIAAALAAALAARGRASLVVSGGKSPVGVFENLRSLPLEWSRVSISLADERWVAVDDAASNERLVRDHLLKEAAASATFMGLKTASATPQLGAAEAWSRVATLPRPFDVVILGMGDDGHTASLFPGSPQLARALDDAAAPGCIGMISPTAPEARLSLNLSALLDSRQLFLFLSGAGKWRVYAAASGPGPVEEMPVRAVLRQGRTPLEVIWSP
jgi:6-phosphogluconolactonase